jgi:hypothetical protein
MVHEGPMYEERERRRGGGGGGGVSHMEGGAQNTGLYQEGTLAVYIILKGEASAASLASAGG